jgi:hypothetical protein
MKQVREATVGERLSFVKKGDPEEILTRFRCFNKFSRINVKVIAELGFLLELLTSFRKFGTCKTLGSETYKIPESGTRDDRESRTRGTIESGTRDTLESGICEIRESAEVQVRKLQCTRIFMYERFGSQEEAKSKTLPQKSGFNV